VWGWGVEEGPEGHDGGPSESDALVSVGVDWGESVYGGE